MKKILKAPLIMGCVLLSFVIVFSVTYAINTYASGKTNLFRLTNLEGTIDDAEYTVTNKSNMPTVVRVMILPVVTRVDDQNTYLLSQDILNPGTLAADWADGGDGYYYHTKPIHTGASVSVFSVPPTVVSPAPSGFDGANVVAAIKAEFSSTVQYDTDTYAYQDAWPTIPSAIDEAIQAAIEP